MTVTPPTVAAEQPRRATRRLRSSKSRESWAGLGMIAPAGILLVLFLIIPVILAFTLSFTNARLISPNPPRFVGFDNFIRAFTADPVFVQSVGNTAVFALVVVPAFKRASATSCPWDLAAFGGALPYVPHWRLGLTDGGPGHCFPSGHAVAAFAYYGVALAWSRHRPRLARAWGIGVTVFGLAFGWAQLARGAHFVSHTLWSAWLCWTVGVGTQALTQLARAQRVRFRRSAPARRNADRRAAPSRPAADGA